MRENDTDTMLDPVDVVLALSLLSRLPVKTFCKIPDAKWSRQARAVWAFPIVGVVLGTLAALVGWLATATGLPAPVVAGLVLTTLIITTGAMHEDGLADCADGFWGGWDPARRLEIMKDSQIGSYGVLVLILITGLRWIGYGAVLSQGTGTIIATAVLSRAVLPAVMATLPHARTDGLSHLVGKPPKRSAYLAAAIGLAIAVIVLGWSGLAAAVAAVLAAFGIATLARVKIGGQTGDVLGAVQQLAELAVILTLIL